MELAEIGAGIVECFVVLMRPSWLKLLLTESQSEQLISIENLKKRERAFSLKHNWIVEKFSHIMAYLE